MPTDHEPTFVRGRFGHPGEDLDEQVGAELGGVPPDDVEPEHGAPAHGVHVGRGVDRGDPSPGPRVVDDGRDDVDRRDECAVVIKPPDGGVITGAEDQIVMRRVGQTAQNLRQLAGGELAASPGAVTELG